MRHNPKRLKDAGKRPSNAQKGLLGRGHGDGNEQTYQRNIQRMSPHETLVQYVKIVGALVIWLTLLAIYFKI